MHPRAHVHLLALLIAHYGYLILFLGTIFEGETIIVLAGFAAYEGHLKLAYIIPIAILGAMIGDQSFFYLGRYKGKQLFVRYPNLKKKVERVHQLTKRYHSWIIFGSRFMYGFRIIIPVSFGAGGISAVKFFLLDFLGALLWAPLFAFGGYAFGNVIEHFLGRVRRFEEVVVVGALVLFAVTQIIIHMRGKRTK